MTRSDEMMLSAIRLRVAMQMNGRDVSVEGDPENNHCILLDTSLKRQQRVHLTYSQSCKPLSSYLMVSYL